MWTMLTVTQVTTGQITWPPGAAVTTAAKRLNMTEDLAMPSESNDDLKKKQKLDAPEPRGQSADATLKSKAEVLIRIHGITFNSFKGQRCIHTETALSAEDKATICEAVRKDLV